ncbi:MAG TPA: metallophosphoesterase, partial [Terriglobia bacterium]
MRKAVFVFLFLVLASVLTLGQLGLPAQIQFIFTADSHYGLTRPAFRGATNVDAHVVNAAMIAKMNSLPGDTLPADGGLRSGQRVGPIDFLVDGGDIANREEAGERPIQSAAASWAQFRSDYLSDLTLFDWMHRKSAVYVVPGNHDASNAVGYHKPMMPRIDKTSMAEIFNLMMKPSPPKTEDSYNYV